MIELGINIDHVATLRQARGTTYPDPIKAALLAEGAGADLITLHLREDRRHIQDADVKQLRPLLKTRMNLELAVTEEMIAIALQIKPQDVCLVPEKREELTTERGRDGLTNFERVKHAVKRLHDGGIRVSLFVDPDLSQLDAAERSGARVVELHTGAYVDAQCDVASDQLDRSRRATSHGQQLGFLFNTFQGLHFGNVQPIAAIAEISALNIGHAMVDEAIFLGWRSAIKVMKRCMHEKRA